MNTTSINAGGTNTSTHLQGQAYTIEQFTVLPSTGSTSVAPVTYTSAEYSNNPAGYAQSNWPFGAGVLGLGLLLGAVGVMLHLVGGKKHQHIRSDLTPGGSAPPFTRR